MYVSVNALPAHIKYPIVAAGAGISSRLASNGDASYIIKVALEVYRA